MLKEIIIVIGHALVGWGLCGATIGIGRNVTSMENIKDITPVVGNARLFAGAITN